MLAGEHSFRLVHISTDCVFDGSRGAYRENDPVNARDSYGKTKASGEVYGDGCLTLRTSIIGKELFHRQGLLEWFIGKRGETVQGFTKAFFSGLTTQAFSRLLLTVLTEYPELEGLFHVSSDRISKYDLLTKVNERLGLNIEIIPDETVDIDRSLDSSLFRSVTQLPIPSWDAMISELQNDLAEYE
jgi:dTDP-4-dehydrorhamnose reductase